MKDVFKEQLVKRRPDIKTAMAKAGLVSVAIFLMALVIFFEALVVFAPILWAVTIFVTYYLMRRQNIEYEYVLTNHELDIDIIYGKSKRKRLISTSARDFEAFRPAGSTEMEHGFTAAAARLDYSGGPAIDGINQYEFLIMHNGKKTRISFEPNADLLAAIIPHLKRGTYPASLSQGK